VASRAVAAAQLSGLGLVRPPVPLLPRRANGAEAGIIIGGRAVTWSSHTAVGFEFHRVIAM